MSKGTDYYSAAELERESRKLTRQALKSPEGIAPENLEKYPNHYTMLTVRTKTGGAELHKHYADFFVVVDGQATLVTGGRLVGSEVVSDGELRGSSVAGGHRQKLGKDDIVHISPNTPHQLLLSPGKTFAYFVIKVRE